VRENGRRGDREEMEGMRGETEGMRRRGFVGCW
jgi:hypothetical protein